MRYLIVYAHPNPASFNHAILETIEGELRKAGKEVVVRDLYGNGFSPVLGTTDFLAMQQGTVSDDVKAEQAALSAADVVIFVYPLWWSHMPAMLKGYIDRIFSDGFAYRITETGGEGLLQGKKVLLVTTTGATREMYEKMNMFTALAKTTDAGIFGFCGMELIEHLYLTAVPYVTDEERRKMLDDLGEFIRERLLS